MAIPVSPLETSSPSLLVQHAEAKWGIDTASLGCVLLQLDAPLHGNETLRCSCPDVALCQSVLMHIHEMSESYTAGRGERDWDEHHSRGGMHVYTFLHNPSRFFEMSEEIPASEARILEEQWNAE